MWTCDKAHHVSLATKPCSLSTNYTTKHWKPDIGTTHIYDGA